LRPVPLTAPRGTITDRGGRIIAETVPGYSVALLASSEDSLRAYLRRVSRFVAVDSSDAADVIERYRQARYLPAEISRDASFDDVSRLEEHRAELPGLVIQSEPRRVYPDGRVVAHLVGYLGEVTQADLEADRYPGSQLGTLVGRAGLEEEYDDSLRGASGIRYIEVDARGRLVREEGAAPSLPPIPGRSLVTTIDLGLQKYIDSIWPAGVHGAMVAITPKGEIRAFYSTPSYDPNDFIGGISEEKWRALNDSTALPLLNRALQVRYPPASPFKLAIASMALRRGLIDFNTHMAEPCRGGIQFGNRFFKCWKADGHGSLDLTSAIAQSCDVYFYQLGLRLGLPAILEDGVSLGFHDRSAVDLPNEMSPIFPTSSAYYDRLYGPRNWSSAVTLNLAIGQGENTQTLMNMIRFYQGLAGGGVSTTPYLVRPAGSLPRKTGLSDEQLDGIRKALVAVVERGTAAASRQADLEVAGKTGTAQNPHGADHGWFIGFAPASNPEIVIGGIMEYVRHGTFVAPYVVRAIRRYLLGPGAEGKGSHIRVVSPDDAPPAPDQATPVPDTVVADSNR